MRTLRLAVRRKRFCQPLLSRAGSGENRAVGFCVCSGASMRGVSVAALAPSIAATDKSGSILAISWQRILREAKLYWPRNTSKHLARITGASQRTVYRWLSEKTEPPGSAVVAIVLALKAEYVARGRIFEQLDLDLG